jgi:hypothetical protein
MSLGEARITLVTAVMVAFQELGEIGLPGTKDVGRLIALLVDAEDLNMSE